MNRPEIELKFGVDEKALAKLAGHPALAAPARTRQLRSVYFDTQKQTLRRANLTLRVRVSKDGFIQTLKQEGPGAQLARQEWETPVADERPNLAALSKTPAAQALDGREADLAPVFVTTVKRTLRKWTKGDNLVEVSLDEGEIASGAQREPIHELELEFKSGEPASVFELADELVRLGQLNLLFESKAHRGYRLAGCEAETPQGATVDALDRKLPASEAFRRIAWNCLGQIGANARLLRERQSLEALHQTRVGLRRFRAALKAFKPMIEDSRFSDLKSETKWLAGELDGARDIDIFIRDGFRPMQVDDGDRDAFAVLGSRLLQAQSEAYARAVAAVASPRFAELQLKAAAWIECGEWLSSDDPVRSVMRDRRSDAFARDRLQRLQRPVMKLGRKLDKLEPSRRHRLRIRAKRLRYAAEFFGDCFNGRRRQERLLDSLADLQDGLGSLQDVAVAHDLAVRQIKELPAEAGFAAGLIIAARKAAATQADQQAQAAFTALGRARPFW